MKQGNEHRGQGPEQAYNWNGNERNVFGRGDSSESKREIASEDLRADRVGEGASDLPGRTEKRRGFGPAGSARLGSHRRAGGDHLEALSDEEEIRRSNESTRIASKSIANDGVATASESTWMRMSSAHTESVTAAENSTDANESSATSASYGVSPLLGGIKPTASEHSADASTYVHPSAAAHASHVLPEPPLAHAPRVDASRGGETLGAVSSWSHAGSADSAKGGADDPAWGRTTSGGDWVQDHSQAPTAATVHFSSSDTAPPAAIVTPAPPPPQAHGSSGGAHGRADAGMDALPLPVPQSIPLPPGISPTDGCRGPDMAAVIKVAPEVLAPGEAEEAADADQDPSPALHSTMSKEALLAQVREPAPYSPFLLACRPAGIGITACGGWVALDSGGSMALALFCCCFVGGLFAVSRAGYLLFRGRALALFCCCFVGGMTVLSLWS